MAAAPTCGFPRREDRRICAAPSIARVRCRIAGREWCYVCAEHLKDWLRGRPRVDWEPV